MASCKALDTLAGGRPEKRLPYIFQVHFSLDLDDLMCYNSQRAYLVTFYVKGYIHVISILYKENYGEVFFFSTIGWKQHLQQAAMFPVCAIFV